MGNADLLPYLWFSMLKAPSDAQLSIVGLEVELGSGRTHGSRHLLVEIVDVLLELSLSLGGRQVEGEGLGVLGDFELTRRLPASVLFVHEVSVPGLVPEHSEVLEQLKRDGFGDDCSSGLRGHVGVVVIVDVSSPLLLDAEVVGPGVLSGLIADVVGHEEAGSCAIDPAPPLSSSDLEDPVVGVETESGGLYVSLAMCSNMTLLRRCLSRWRRQSSGV